jgi:hypothetical protein
MTAAPNYLVDNLVTSVRNKYLTPNSQSTFEDTDVASLLDEEMRSDIFDVVNSTRGDYWVTTQNLQVTGQQSYTIPIRTIAGALRDAVFLDANGNRIELTRMTLENTKFSIPIGWSPPLYSFGYFLQDDKLYLFPQQGQFATGYRLQFQYYRRPSNLTLSTNCGQITAINPSTNVVSLSYVDPTWTTSTLFDIIQNFPQFTSISDNTPITNISGFNITLNAIPTGLAVGMWFCPQYMTCIPQIPYEGFPLLEQRAIIRIAESIGDAQGAQMAEKRYEEMKIRFTNLISPRVQNGPKIFCNRNRLPSWGGLGVPYVR